MLYLFTYFSFFMLGVFSLDCLDLSLNWMIHKFSMLFSSDLLLAIFVRQVHKKARPKTNKKTIDESICTGLVVWGTNLRSTVGCGRITKQVRDMIKLPPYQYSVIVGLLLSDGYFWSGSCFNSR